MTARRLSQENILELQQTLIDTTLECCHFKEVVHNNGDGPTLQMWTDSFAVSYDLRSFTLEDASKLNATVEQSDLFRWWTNRMNIAIRSTSIEPELIDTWIVTALDFTTGADTLMQYTEADLKPSDWATLIHKYPIMRVMALWNMLNIPFQILLLSRAPKDEQSNDGSTPAK